MLAVYLCGRDPFGDASALDAFMADPECPQLLVITPKVDRGFKKSFEAHHKSFKVAHCEWTTREFAFQQEGWRTAVESAATGVRRILKKVLKHAPPGKRVRLFFFDRSVMLKRDVTGRRGMADYFASLEVDRSEETVLTTSAVTTEPHGDAEAVPSVLSGSFWCVTRKYLEFVRGFLRYVHTFMRSLTACSDLPALLLHECMCDPLRSSNALKRAGDGGMDALGCFLGAKCTSAARIKVDSFDALFSRMTHYPLPADEYKCLPPPCFPHVKLDRKCTVALCAYSRSLHDYSS